MLLVLMSTTVSAALGAPGVLSLREAARLSDEREQAEKAAQLAAESFTTYDYRDLSSSFDSLLEAGTDEFRRTFGQATSELRPIIREQRAVSTGNIISSAVADLEPGKTSSVLVEVDVYVSQRKGQGPQRRFRLQLDLKEVDGSWLLDKIETVT